MRVLLFNGSPRLNGNTMAMLRLAGAEMESEGIACEYIQLGGLPLRGCMACGGCRKESPPRCAMDSDPVNGWIDRIAQADGLLIGSPVYFGSVSSAVKSFIDRVGYVVRSRPEALRRKPAAAVVSVRRAGALTTFDTINHFFSIAEMVVVGSSYWNMTLSRDLEDWKKDEEGIATMKTLGQNMAWALKRLRGE